jgi:hypothetical protein
VVPASGAHAGEICTVGGYWGELHAGDADITGSKCGEARVTWLAVWRNSRYCTLVQVA